MTSSTSSSQIQAVFIPDDSSPNNLAQEIDFACPGSPEFKTRILQLLGCPLEEVEPMYSEELMSMFNGNSDGLPPGHEFVAYEAWMDENGNSTRPKNSRVERIFSRPRSHGPMLFVKTVYAKDPSHGLKVIRREPLRVSELESPAFQDKRKEYINKYAEHRDRMLAQLTGEGWTIQSL